MMLIFKPIDVDVPLIRIALSIDLGKAYSVHEIEDLTDLTGDRIRRTLADHHVPSRKQARPKHDFSAQNYKEHLNLEVDDLEFRSVRVWRAEDIVFATRRYLEKAVPKVKKKTSLKSSAPRRATGT